jgi:glycosyltransferase involved in cell wall biosynthesis
MSAPLVSILIPAYNERFFAEALASALGQAYPAIEVVVCDDSGGQSIRGIVDRAADTRVRYVRNPHRLGFGGNFTRCFQEARGEYVKFLNDDDRLHPQCVEGLAEPLQTNAAVTLAFSRRSVIDATGARRPDIPATVALSHIPALFSGRDLGNLVLANSINFIGEPTSVLFRKRDLQLEADSVFRWGEREYHCLADVSLWLRLLARGLAFYTPAPWSDFRIHEGQEQQRAMLTCVIERYWIACKAREAGYLADPRLWTAALRAARERAVATDSGAASEGAARQLRELVAAIDSDLEARERACPL